MDTKKWIRVIGFGLIIWGVPFVISFFFYSRDGQLQVDLMLFKTVMLLVSALTGAVCIYQYFKRATPSFLQEGIQVGLSWLVIQWILDVLILIPMSKMTFNAYFVAIGLRYLLIPIYTITVGVVLDGKRSRHDDSG